MATDNARATNSKGLTALVWIEDRSSRIARGEADAVTSEGMHVTLADAPGFGQGDVVAVRLSFERGARTVATSARVAWLRGSQGRAECGLQWSGPPEERKDLEAWLHRAA